MDAKVRAENRASLSSIKKVLGVVVSGCSGRMGRRLLSLILADPELRLLGGICRSATDRVPCETRKEALHMQGQKETLPTKDFSSASFLKVSHFVSKAQLAADAGSVGEGSAIVHDRKEAELEAPICASLADLDSRLQLSQNVAYPCIVVDFSHPAGTLSLLPACVRLHIPLVVGTTGFTAEEKLTIKLAAQNIPLCLASNFSVGVSLLIRLVDEVTVALGEHFDIELVEAHHNRKADAPSGTAVSILETIAQARQRVKPSSTCVDQATAGPADDNEERPSNALFRGKEHASTEATIRTGTDVRRKRGDVGVHSLRLGNIVGEHSVIYANSHERIILQHHAESRDAFAIGALRMSKWLALKPKGEYSVHDMLFQNPLQRHSCS